MQEYSFKVLNRAVKANRAFKDTQVYSNKEKRRSGNNTLKKYRFT